MDWNAITATVESQLADQEQELAAEEDELARQRTALRKRRGALRARRKAFEQCREVWASIDQRLESDDDAGSNGAAGAQEGGADPGLKIVAAAGDG